MMIKKILLKLLNFMFTLVFALMSTLPTVVYGQTKEEKLLELEKNTIETEHGAVVSSCVVKGATRGPTQKCCPGLIDKNNKCEDTAVSDPGLAECGDSGQCQKGLSCLPQSEGDLFSLPPATEDELLSMNRLEDVKDEEFARMGNTFRPKREGDTCYRNVECASYNCEPKVVGKNSSGKDLLEFRCVDKKICRLPGEGERPNGGSIECDDGLKLERGVCVVPKENSRSVYLGLIQEGTVQQVEGKVCQFELKERETYIQSMQSARSLEWLMASIDDEDDCMKITPYLRKQLKEYLLKEKQRILRDFNDRMAKIDEDFKTLTDVKDDSKETVNIHGEPIPARTLALRRTSGYDMLLLMYERNEILTAYEVAMNNLTLEVSKRLSKLHKDIEKWTDHSATKWSVNGVPYEGDKESCRGGGFLGLGRRKIYKRWAKRYWLKDTDENIKVVGKKEILGHLHLISGKSNDEIMSEIANQKRGFLGFGTRKRYLIDPLVNIDDIVKEGQSAIQRGLDFGVVGLAKALANHPYPVSNFAIVRQGIKEKLRDYYKKLRVDSKQTNFIYEPELVELSVRNCIDDPKGQGCEKFDKYLEGVTDVAFAQFIGWSYHTRKNYKHYFDNSNSWRRGLLARWEGDLVNLNKYYTEMNKLRSMQNECIGKVIRQVAPNGLDQLAGLNYEEKNYYDGKNYLNADGTKKTVGKSNTFTKNDRSQYQFNLNTGSMSMRTGGNVAGKVSEIDGGGRGSVDAELQAAMAARVKEMKAANKSAEAAGVNIANKEKAFAETIASLSQGSINSGGSLSSGALNSSAIGGAEGINTSGTDKAKLAEEMKESDRSGNNEFSKTKTLGAPQPTGGLGGFSGLDPYERNGGNSSGFESGNYQDPTGMSDEEKEVMMANYERTKSEYRTDDDDTLFKTISKAYVRSLDKVLTKRKRIQD